MEINSDIGFIVGHRTTNIISVSRSSRTLWKTINNIDIAPIISPSSTITLINDIIELHAIMKPCRNTSIRVIRLNVSMKHINEFVIVRLNIVGVTLIDNKVNIVKIGRHYPVVTVNIIRMGTMLLILFPFLPKAIREITISVYNILPRRGGIATAHKRNTGDIAMQGVFHNLGRRKTAQGITVTSLFKKRLKVRVLLNKHTLKIEIIPVESLFQIGRITTIIYFFPLNGLRSINMIYNFFSARNKALKETLHSTQKSLCSRRLWVISIISIRRNNHHRK